MLRIGKLTVEVPSKLSDSVEVSTNYDYFDCSCSADDQDCILKCLTEDNKNDGIGNMFLLTAGEVLLGTAIIMGLSALVTLLLRACTRSRMPRNGRDIPDILDAFDRNGNRASLTSLQQSVMSKLRDRPPRYETRHNYEYRRREDLDGDRVIEQTHQATSIRNVAVLNPNVNRINEPPPSYETTEDANSVHELPPAYTINLSSHDDGSNRGGENQTECVGGITNQSFTCDDEQQQSQRQGQTTDAIDNTRNEDDIRNNSITNRTCDSVLYI
ncbi:uncharacterized protein [Chironomus tepperi]|uniref:uncharacterized protein isoform X2 n=1 Tax=Chironomus tepperi TaxID=113505 RepID=UPI00391F30CD